MNRRQKEKQWLYWPRAWYKTLRRASDSHKRWEREVTRNKFLAEVEALEWVALEALQCTARKEPPTT